MMLSSAAYIDALQPKRRPVQVTADQCAALKALNEAAYAARKAFGRYHECSTDLALMAKVTDAMVDRADVGVTL